MVRHEDPEEPVEIPTTMSPSGTILIRLPSAADSIAASEDAGGASDVTASEDAGSDESAVVVGVHPANSEAAKATHTRTTISFFIFYFPPIFY